MKCSRKQKRFSHQRRSVRQARAWSHVVLAELLEGHPKTISRWERGEALLPPSLQKKLSNLFGRPTDVSGYAQKTSPSHEVFSMCSLQHLMRKLPVYDPSLPLALLQSVGREGDLERIKVQLCAGGKVPISALNGLPAVGKMALAHSPAFCEHFRWGRIGLP